MKAMKKALALGLALAMVVTAVPVTNAQAASTGLPKSKNYYAGKTYTLKLTTPSSWKSVKTKWSEKSSAVSLSSKKAKSVKVKAIKKGSATVKATVTYKKSSKSYKKTYSCKVTVKDPVLNAAEATTVAVGAKVSAKAVKATPASATVTYTTDNAEVATVDETTGEVTGVKAGEATITATLTCGTETVTATTKVTVKNVILESVKQTKADTLEAVIVGNAKDVKVTDIKITNTSNNVTYAVKDITVDAKDATKVYITTYVKMTDGKDYNVELDGVVKTFTATDGVVVAVGLEKTEIVAATATKINAVVKGANDVVLDTVAYPGNGTVTVSINVTNGYTTADSLYLNNVGDTATVDVVYHTGKYDANGNETGNIEAKGIVVTAVAAEVVTVDGWAVKIGGTAANFDKVTETKLAVGDAGKFAFIQMTNSKNEKSSDLREYTVETSNKDALLVSDASKVDGKFTLTPIKEGTTYLLVKDSKGTVVTTLPITIVAARKTTTLELDKTSVTLSTSISEETDIEFTLKDQYGEKLTAPATAKLETLTYNDGTKTVNNNTTFNVASASLTSGKYTVESSGKTDGTYVVKATIDGLSKTFTVVIQTAKPAKADKSNVSYTLDMPTSTADAVIKADATANTEITATVYELHDGIKAAAVTSGAISVTLKNSKGDSQSSFVNVASTGKITITVANKTTGAKLAAGTYTLTITNAPNEFAPTFTRNIVITDTQSPVTVKRVSETGANVGACFEFWYEGKKIIPTSVIYKNPAGSTIVATSGPVAVGSADVTITLPDSANKVQVNVPIGLTVTLN